MAQNAIQVGSVVIRFEENNYTVGYSAENGVPTYTLTRNSPSKLIVTAHTNGLALWKEIPTSFTANGTMSITTLP